MIDRTYFDENTLLKVYAALEVLGLTQPQAENVINAILNAGILFRERILE